MRYTVKVSKPDGTVVHSRTDNFNSSADALDSGEEFIDAHLPKLKKGNYTVSVMRISATKPKKSRKALKVLFAVFLIICAAYGFWFLSK